MRTTIVTALLTAVVFAVAGCALVPRADKVVILKHPHGSKDCRGKDCDVTIKFVCVDSKDPKTCAPYAAEEVILVNPNHKIEFSLDGRDYEFDTGGIRFSAGRFDCSAQGPRKYKCDNREAAPGLYKYEIRIRNMEPVDPWVVNY